jgi:hypothetical protein
MFAPKLRPIMAHPAFQKKVVLIGHCDGAAGHFGRVHNAVIRHIDLPLPAGPNANIWKNETQDKARTFHWHATL